MLVQAPNSKNTECKMHCWNSFVDFPMESNGIEWDGRRDGMGAGRGGWDSGMVGC